MRDVGNGVYKQTMLNTINELIYIVRLCDVKRSNNEVN